MTKHSLDSRNILTDAAGWSPPPDYRWTREVAEQTIKAGSFPEIKDRVIAILRREHMVLPDEESTVERCVTALLVGHLILQGPPGTGKTTLAKALAEAFNVDLTVTTATSEWSPFHVVGGLRPTRDGGLESTLGVVPSVALTCARKATGEEAPSEGQSLANWLLIDEFNRADIDKAIGGLYTVLSSCDPSHLANTPVELWFESREESRYLWVPASFRIIGTMNDLDTSYVSPMSQGLRRRFQFITIGVPEFESSSVDGISEEIQAAYNSALSWLAETYGGAEEVVADDETLRAVQRVLTGLRYPSDTGADGWPVGTAQAADVLRSYLLAVQGTDSKAALDVAIADRLIAQMNAITKAQFEAFRRLLESEQLTRAAAQLSHLYRPYAV